jgi:DNA-binding transcriptional regulator YdaS (Cro superfamily)
MLRRMFLGFPLLTIFVAPPLAAQVGEPRLPPAPRGLSYIETRCTGGFVSRNEITRVALDGSVVRATRRSQGAVRGRVAPGEVAVLMRRLDTAGFDTLRVPPGPPVADGIDCTLTRQQQGRTRSVTITQSARERPSLRLIVGILDAVNAIGAKAAPIPLRPMPVESPR